MFPVDVWQFNMILTSIDSHRNADNTLSGTLTCLSGFIRWMDRYYSTGYDFLWVTIHINQSNIVLKPVLSHRTVHTIPSNITIHPPWWFLVNVGWKDSMASLHVSSESICIFDNVPWSSHQHIVTGMTTTPFQHPDIPFRSYQDNRHPPYQWMGLSVCKYIYLTTLYECNTNIQPQKYPHKHIQHAHTSYQ